MLFYILHETVLTLFKSGMFSVATVAHTSNICASARVITECRTSVRVLIEIRTRHLLNALPLQLTCSDIACVKIKETGNVRIT